MLVRRILVVALAVLSPFGRLPAQFGVPGPYIQLTFLADPPFQDTCIGQPQPPYSASCTVLNSVGGVMAASAAITPGGPTGSVFTQASFSGNLAPQSFVDVESLASLEEEIWFAGGNPNDIFSVAVSGSLQWTVSPSAGNAAQSFVILRVGEVRGGVHYQFAANGYSTSDDTFNVTIQTTIVPPVQFLDPLDAFFFRLSSETIVVASNGSMSGGFGSVSASSFADPFVTFYDEAGNDITGNYTLSYIPAPDVVATPEPATFTTTLTGLLGVVGFVSRRRRTLQTLS